MNRMDRMRVWLILCGKVFVQSVWRLRVNNKLYALHGREARGAEVPMRRRALTRCPLASIPQIWTSDRPFNDRPLNDQLFDALAEGLLAHVAREVLRERAQRVLHRAR